MNVVKLSALYRNEMFGKKTTNFVYQWQVGEDVYRNISKVYSVTSYQCKWLCWIGWNEYIPMRKIIVYPLFTRYQAAFPSAHSSKTGWDTTIFAMVTYDICVKILSDLSKRKGLYQKSWMPVRGYFPNYTNKLTTIQNT